MKYLAIFAMSLSVTAFAAGHKDSCVSSAESYVQELLQEKGASADLVAPTQLIKVYNPNIDPSCEVQQLVHTSSGDYNIECDNDDDDGDGCGCDPQLHLYNAVQDSAGC